MGKRGKIAAPFQHRSNAAPTLGDLIMAAVSASGTHVRRGISLVALKKALSKAGYDVQRNNARVNQSVRSLVTKGSLHHVTGSGASGSFRVSKELQGKPGAGGKKKRAAANQKRLKRPSAPRRRVGDKKKKLQPAGKPRGGGGGGRGGASRKKPVVKSKRPVGRPRKVEKKLIRRGRKAAAASAAVRPAEEEGGRNQLQPHGEGGGRAEEKTGQMC